MNFQPLGKRVLVQRLEEATTTASGIIIPDNAKEKPMQGTVVAVGAGRKSDKGEVIAPEVKVGDKVLYGKYSGTEINVDSKSYLIVKESDILAIL